MDISEILTKTTNDPSLVWSALAVAIQCCQLTLLIVSAIVVIYQYRQIRRETIESKVGGLRTAIELLEETSVRSVTRELINGRPVGGADWERVLNQINLVGLLILEKYTDEKLLLRLKSRELAAVGRFLQSGNVDIEMIREKYPHAVDLAQRASEDSKQRLQ